MVTPGARVVLAAVVTMVLALTQACTLGSPSPPSGTEMRQRGTTVDPSPEQVTDTLRYGGLAPLPRNARVLASSRAVGQDESRDLTIRMAAAEVEPFLNASGMPLGRYFNRLGSNDAFGDPLPEGLPGTDQSTIVRPDGARVTRAAGIQAEPGGTALVHVQISGP